MKDKDKRIGFLLERTTRIAKLSFTKAFKKLNVDITPEQWVVIDAIKKKGPLSQKDIGKSSYKNAPTISRIIDVLVKKELVNRIGEEGDRRKTSISLTDEGQAIYMKCKKEVGKLRALSWNELNDKEYDEFTRILDKVFDNFNSY